MRPSYFQPVLSELTIKSRSKGLTEQGLARLGYKDTIILRPGFLAQAERTEKRAVEPIIRCISPPKYLHGAPLTHISPSYVFGAIGKISDQVEIPVAGVAAAAIKLGLLGSEKIPKEASPAVVNVPTKDGLPAGKFTLVNNAGLLQLARLKAK